MLKSEALRVEKAKTDTGEVKIHAKEGQSGVIKAAEQSKPEAHNISDDMPRERRLAQWLGATFESIKTLLEVYNRLIPQLTNDVEVNSGIMNISRLAESMVVSL